MDVTVAVWRTSSYSGSNGGACVEVGTAGPAVAIRDSKHPDGPLLAFAADTWKTFTDRVKASALPQISTEERLPLRRGWYPRPERAASARACRAARP
jgi:Domain of unknown function (DUF397)